MVRRWTGWGIFCAAVVLTCTEAGAAPAQHGAQSARNRAPAAIVELRVAPNVLTLDNARDSRRLLVSGRRADGFWVDLTADATFRLAAPLARRDADGYFAPVKAGRTALAVSAAGRSVSVPVTVRSVASPPISFVREVMPVMARAGCNAGTCHGAAKGKNGFKLSLRGYDPDYDYHALVDDLSGRRFNRADPAQSLMLLKPTQGVPHQGGLVFEKESRFYPLLYRWIAEGVRSDAGKVARANGIEVLPAAPKMGLPGTQQQLLVVAHYPDGSTRDVTRDAVFTSTVPDTVAVTPDGEVTAVRRGEAAVLVRYEGNYAANGVTVIGDRTGYRWAAQPQYNEIDRLVDAKLQRIKAVPSGFCTDAEFIRRASLDIAGLSPAPDEVRAFLADRTPARAKRAALVERLLGSPDYIDFWTNRWADLLSVNRKFLGEKGTWKFRNWIYGQVASNRPYDAFVRELITASGSSYEHPAASYFRVSREPNVASEHATQLFLGVRFSCNKCHDHPFERWTQSQYYELAAYFGRVALKPGLAEGDEAVYDRNDGEVVHPRTNRPVQAVFPYTVRGVQPAAASRREALAAWLTSPQNPYFARSYVNRVWSYFLGRGIIDPVDDIRSSNPASNPELLDRLTADFVRGGFDVKQLIRTICASRTYQASVRTNRWNADDGINFSHAVPRRLTAEQLMDAIGRATGSVPRYPGVPGGFRAVQLPDTGVAAGGFLDLFGRPAREAPCECERASTVSLGQTLSLVNGPTIADALVDPNGRIARLVKDDPDERRIVEELFLAALCRPPSAAEMGKALTTFRLGANDIRDARQRDPKKPLSEQEARIQLKAEAAQDILWALLNTPAFLFNR